MNPKFRFTLVVVSILTFALNSSAQIFTGDGTWHTPGNWDTGSLPIDGATTIINGNAVIDQDIGSANTFNPARLVIGENATGSLRVTAGTLSGAHGGGANGGIYVGVGPTGVGELIIEDGAALRSQGGTMRVRVGDFDGGTGRLVIAGELLNFKFFEIFNGTLEMRPTGINNKFNSNEISIISSTGTLSYLINGSKIGALERANTSGLNVEIEFGANLEITLTGNFQVGDSWTLMKYTSLAGFFAQDFAFTNQQGFQFDVDYGSGFDDELNITLTSTADRPEILSFQTTPPAISAGSTSTLSWEVGSFDSLEINPDAGDISAMTSNGKGSIEVSPTETTAYEILLVKNGVEVKESLMVVVEAAPIVTLLEATPALIAPGDSTILRWVVEGTSTVSISPDMGTTTARGEFSLSPSKTTTYTLTAENEFGSVTETFEVIADAILVARTNVYNAADAGNTNGFFKDSVGINNFDLKSNVRDTDIQTFRTKFTAANRMVSFTNDTGGDALGFPGGDSSFELWVRPGELDDRHQVLFETGGGDNGFSFLITQNEVRFINSVASNRTIDLTVSLSEIETTDFIQIVAVLEDAAGKVTLYINGSGGGAVSGFASGDLGAPNGRSTVFSWSSFAAGIAGALGGSAGEEPENTTQFRGELALLNVFGRSLTEQEVQTQFDRHTIPDPGIINSFTATPDRAASGTSILLEWDVNAFDSIQISPEIGDVSQQTVEGIGSIEITLENSARMILTAENSDGGSVVFLNVLADVDLDTVVLEKSNSAWADGNNWSDGKSPQGNADYVVLDFLATNLNTPNTLNPVFQGRSLELRGNTTELNLVPGFNSTVQINQLVLNGGSIVHGTEIDTIVLSGNIEVSADSRIEVSGVLKTLIINSNISGPGRITVTMDDALLDQTFLFLDGNNSNHQGGWIFTGGRTTVNSAEALGSGSLSINNGILELHPDWNGSDAVIAMTGDQAALYLSTNTRLKALNIIPDSGIPFSVPAGTYDFDSWTDFTLANPDLGLNPWLAFLGDITLDVLDEVPVEIPGPTFNGEGDWNNLSLWNNGFPGDGDNAIINGIVIISEDIASANTLNPGRIFVGNGAEGSLTVSGGTLSGAHGGAGDGLFVGLGMGGVGNVVIQESAVFRSQGGGTIVRIGDENGGTGTLTVEGELLNFKFFEIINGTLIMMPDGLNRSFNSTDLSLIGSNGTLSFFIDGDSVGTLERSNDSGLNIQIDPAANLQISLTGSINEGQTWILADYTSLTGQFVQGLRFTNNQGHDVSIDYGAGENSQLTVTLETRNPDAAEPPSISIESADGQIVLTFTGKVETADRVQGPWSEVSNVSSPWSITPDSIVRFYRTRN